MHRMENVKFLYWLHYPSLLKLIILYTKIEYENEQIYKLSQKRLHKNKLIVSKLSECVVGFILENVFI